MRARSLPPPPPWAPVHPSRDPVPVPQKCGVAICRHAPTGDVCFSSDEVTARRLHVAMQCTTFYGEVGMSPEVGGRGGAGKRSHNAPLSVGLLLLSSAPSPPQPSTPNTTPNTSPPSPLTHSTPRRTPAPRGVPPPPLRPRGQAGPPAHRPRQIRPPLDPPPPDPPPPSVTPVGPYSWAMPAADQPDGHNPVKMIAFPSLPRVLVISRGQLYGLAVIEDDE